MPEKDATWPRLRVSYRGPGRHMRNAAPKGLAPGFVDNSPKPVENAIIGVGARALQTVDDENGAGYAQRPKVGIRARLFPRPGHFGAH